MSFKSNTVTDFNIPDYLLLRILGTALVHRRPLTEEVLISVLPEGPLLLYPTAKQVELNEFILMQVIPIRRHNATPACLLEREPGICNINSE
jgi:hypothetical protein